MTEYRSVSSGSTDEGTTFSITKPSGVAENDNLVVLAYKSATAGTMTMSGFTSLADGVPSGGGEWSLFWKVAGSSEPASYTVNLGTTTIAAGIMVASVAGSPDPPIFATDTTQPSMTARDTPGITPDDIGDLEVRFVCGLGEDGSASAWTTPGALTERREEHVANTTTLFEDIGIAVGTRTLASAAATGPLQFTYGGTWYASAGVGVTVSIPSGSFPQTITPTGIASAETFGTAQANLTVGTSGIISGEAFGDLVISTPEPLIIACTGIPSGEMFGTTVMGYVISPSGIASLEAFGTPRLAALIRPTSIPSVETFGLTNVAIEQFIQPAGIASREKFGITVLFVGHPQTIEVVGIPTGERMTQQPIVSLGHRLTLRPPKVQETPAGRNVLHVRYGIDRGISIIQRQDHSIYQTRYPALTDLEAALKYWLGGYVHSLTVEEAEQLTDAGYGDYITLEEANA